MADAVIPQTKFLDDTGLPSRTWRQFLLNPFAGTLATYGVVYSGPAALAAISLTNGQIIVGQTSTAPLAKTLSGDATLNAAGVLTFATVNAGPASYGSGTTVATYTVNAKGLITASASVAITGAPGAFTAVGAFGCNSKTAQAAAASGAAVVATGSTNAAPFGYTTAGQADRIVALLNTIQAALIANGILS